MSLESRVQAVVAFDPEPPAGRAEEHESASGDNYEQPVPDIAPS